METYTLSLSYVISFELQMSNDFFNLILFLNYYWLINVT